MTVESWAERRPWGVDVFAIMECAVCHQHRGTSADTYEGVCHLHMTCCGVLHTTSVIVDEALERGRERDRQRGIFEGA